MASIAFWIPWRYAHRPELVVEIMCETNRSNIRIKVFVHRCLNFVSLFEFFVPLAHGQNNLRSRKKSQF